MQLGAQRFHRDLAMRGIGVTPGTYLDLIGMQWENSRRVASYE